MIVVEDIGKGAVFDCQMCGQCILHSTGMTCPKNLRNGPCGGVRIHGDCEVKPESLCVWTVAYERSLQMPAYGDEMIRIQPPINKLERASELAVSLAITKRTVSDLSLEDYQTNRMA